MIRQIQTTVNVNNDRDLEINAIDEEGGIIQLYNITFSEHAMLTSPLMDDLVETLNLRLRDAAMAYNEEPREAARAITRRIIRKMGMKPH